MIFKDLLRDKNKFRYTVNRSDYSIGRFLDGHTLDGRQQADLRVEVLSPLDVDYGQYSEATCIAKSGDGGGTVLIRLPDHETFFAELRTWLKTNKFIRLNNVDTEVDVARILADRGRENQERKRRLRTILEEILAKSEVYAIGQHLNITSSSIATIYDESCQYLLENTYTKLAYLRVLQQDPARELSAVLNADDLGQLGLSLDGEEGNPLAIREVEQYINLRASSDRVLVSDIIESFTYRPFGWPDMEILLILGRLAVAGRISFQKSGGTLPVKDAFEPLQNSRTRREISVIKKRQVDESILKDARNLTKDLFSALGPDTEKELYEFYHQHLDAWLKNLNSYKSKLEVGKFPGRSAIESSILGIERLLSNDDSYDFFKKVVDGKNEYLVIEESYSDLFDFYTNQLQTWQQLQTALTRFAVNAPALEKNPQANLALQELKGIAASASPYALLHKVAVLISAVEGVNDALLVERRTHAIARVDEKIKQLEVEIAKSGIATAELSNLLLRPLQLVKSNLSATKSISEIYMLQSETASDCFDESLLKLERAMQAAAEKPVKPPKGTGGVEDEQPPAFEPVIPPHPAVDIFVTKVFSRVSSGIYLESQEDIDKLLEALKQELEEAINKNQRVRIR